MQAAVAEALRKHEAARGSAVAANAVHAVMGESHEREQQLQRQMAQAMKEKMGEAGAAALRARPPL